jgi:hypothetical protein
MDAVPKYEFSLQCNDRTARAIAHRGTVRFLYKRVSQKRNSAAISFRFLRA